MHPQQPVKVSSIWEEHTYLAAQRCSCGGDYRSSRWELDFENDRNLEIAHAKCNSCGVETRFLFDVTASFRPDAQDYIKTAWPPPHDGPYSIDEKGYRDAIARHISQLDTGGSFQRANDLGLKQILDEYYPKIAGRFQVHGFRRGSMGVTYLCVDTEWFPASPSPYFVACKTIEHESEDLLIEALKSEARLWLGLGTHPNVI